MQSFCPILTKFGISLKIVIKVPIIIFHIYVSSESRSYRVSQEERTKLRERVPYVKLYRYKPKHLCPKLNGFRDNGK